MNKQRYLAELQRLLVFMTEEDKELTVRRYAQLFDAAGEEGEEALIARLGSPTKTAISLSRGYEPGRLDSVLPAPAAPVKKEKVALTRTEDDPWGDLPDFELPELDFDEPDIPAPKTPEPEAEPATKAEPEKTGPMAPPEAPAEKAPPEAPWRAAGRDEAPVEYDRSMPLGVGIPLFILVIVALGLPIAALFLGLMALLLAPGGAAVTGAYLAAVGGLWCLSYMADAIMMFGLAFLLLALGLVVLCAGIWVDVKLAGVYIAGVRWLSGELLGRRASYE